MRFAVLSFSCSQHGRAFKSLLSFFFPSFPELEQFLHLFMYSTRERERERVVVESDLKPVIKVVSCNGCAREERERGEGNNGKQQSWSH